MLQSSDSRAVLASALVYAAAIAVMARDVFAMLGSGIAGDVGDPVLNAGILAWNATTVPWTETWYDFPAFYPVRDGVTFTEHLLGISPLASPLYWITGNAAVTYNATLMLTYVLSGLAMYALVWRLTRHAPASFLAGLAYAFAPYRDAQLAHLQALAVFWAPLSLLGLHAFLDASVWLKPDRRWLWLALFAVCWMLQGAANGYFLVFFSILVGLWVLWFVVAQRRWRELGLIAAAGLVAALPLVPILVRFMTVHARQLFVRQPEEIASLSADIASVLCGPPHSPMWSWLSAGRCGGEQELFPGVTLIALCAAGMWVLRPTPPGAGRSRLQTIAHRASLSLLVLAFVMLLVAIAVAAGGPWTWSVGPLRASASDVLDPFSRGLILLVLAAVCSPALWAAAKRASVPAFYALAAAITWVLSWGPTPMLLGDPALAQGPYGWLMLLPGVDGLRVPARFWMMTILCLCVLMGLVLAAVLRRRSAGVARLAVAVVGAALLAEGWMEMPAARLVAAPPDPGVLRGETVMTLPLGGNVDIDAAAQYDAVTGGWMSVNGYSGYEPRHYWLLRMASESGDPRLLAPFLGRGDLHVVVYERSEDHVALIEQQPGVREMGRANGLRQYRLPQRGTLPPTEAAGDRLPIASLSASCAPEYLPLVQDGEWTTRWECGPQKAGQTMTVDLGEVREVGTVVPALGPFRTDFPRRLQIETSVDGATWEPAWDEGVLVETIEALLHDPGAVRLILSFAPRPARYVRLQLASTVEVWYWSVAELEVWSAAAGAP